MICTYEIDINASRDRVFELIHNPEMHKRWLQGVEETRYIGDYDPANPVGTKFKQKIREGGKVKEYDGEVTAFARPEHLGIRLWSSGFTVQVEYRLSPMAAGTHLDYSADVSCSGWIMRLLVRVFGLIARLILRKQLRALKALAESDAQT